MVNSKYVITLGMLAAFRQAVSTGSFKDAADALETTEAKIKRRIELLETAWGETLFEVTEDGRALTDVGEHVYQLAVQFLDAIAELEGS